MFKGIIGIMKKTQTESNLIEDITRAVIRKLNQQSTIDLTCNFIPDENYWSVQSLIKFDSTEVQIIGLWGMGGIGKTTLATAMFQRVSFKYDGSCFFEKVTEVSKSHGINYTCNKLLCKLLKEDLDIDTPKLISSMIRRRLKSMKSFIVLDDVHNSELLQNLIGVGHGWLGSGSTVIVTTRDKHVLISGGIKTIYEVKKMNSRNSLRIFSLNAFDKVSPKDGYVELSKRAIDYARGNPLALKVLGSLLRCKSEKEWDCALDKLKKMPNNEIDSIFRMSFNELDKTEQNIFLDIACFFKGQERNSITKILNECGFFADIGISHLLDKALVRVDSENCIQMHGLIQEMGKQIVREESLKNPGQRSRLCDPEEVYDVLKNNRGSEKVEVIFLDATKYTHLILRSDAFEKMENLRLLAVQDHKGVKSISLPDGLGLLPENLRYILWDGYPLKTVPLTSSLEMLVELSLKQSHVEKLWNGVVNLPNLEIIDLSGSKKMIECPNVSEWDGNELPSSILHTQNLKGFGFPISDCLVDLPVNFCNDIWLSSPLNSEHDSFITLDKVLSSPAFVSVKILTFCNINILSEIPNSISLLSSLETLRLIKMPIISLPETIKYLPRLIRVNVYYCELLQSIPALQRFIPKLLFWDCESLEEVFSSTSEPYDKPTPVSTVLLNCVELDPHSYQTVLKDSMGGIELGARKNSENEDAHDHIILIPAMPGMENWFHYPSTEVSVTLELPSNLLGFAYYVVLSQGHMGFDVGFGCECNLENSSGERICITSFKRLNIKKCDWTDTSIDMMSDHLLVWYDPRSCKQIMDAVEQTKAISDGNSTSYTPKLTFTFFIDETLYDEVEIKECGFRWIYQEETVSSTISESNDEEETLSSSDFQSNEQEEIVPATSFESDDLEETIPPRKKLKIDIVGTPPSNPEY
ncbi:TIR-NBS-LRR class disease resistance protein [Medicago truncatula]|uniref:TIR-NBS-LRR class disease resistance protein n=1 Tax=Medicago truncatula TaxID=3880 RepID=A0A072TMH8_MEDTR|nr:TIR-NBS-LRR class disease resistance protein [Medicago truncatula]